MNEPKVGDKDTCKQCGEPIEFIIKKVGREGRDVSIWSHVGSDQPRHRAIPKTEPKS